MTKIPYTVLFQVSSQQDSRDMNSNKTPVESKKTAVVESKKTAVVESKETAVVESDKTAVDESKKTAVDELIRRLNESPELCEKILKDLKEREDKEAEEEAKKAALKEAENLLKEENAYFEKVKQRVEEAEKRVEEAEKRVEEAKSAFNKKPNGLSNSNKKPIQLLSWASAASEKEGKLPIRNGKLPIGEKKRIKQYNAVELIEIINNSFKYYNCSKEAGFGNNNPALLFILNYLKSGKYNDEGFFKHYRRFVSPLGWQKDDIDYTKFLVPENQESILRLGSKPGKIKNDFHKELGLYKVGEDYGYAEILFKEWIEIYFHEICKHYIFQKDGDNAIKIFRR